MATVTEKLLTAEEFYDLPDDDDDTLYELVDGRLEHKFYDEDGTPMSGAFAPHGIVCARLSAQIFAHVTAHDLGIVVDGQTTFLIHRDPDTVYGPDVAFVSWDRFPDGQVRFVRYSFPPDFVAEVLSTGDRPGKVRRKIRDYLDAGVPLVWLADPKQRVVTEYAPDRPVRVYGENDTLDGGDVLPGLRIPVAPLFVLERPLRRP